MVELEGKVRWKFETNVSGSAERLSVSMDFSRVGTRVGFITAGQDVR